MRIFLFVVRSLLVLLGVTIVVGLVVREVLLIWATSQLQTDLKTVRQALKDGNYAANCLKNDSVFIEGEELAIAQMKFTSSTEYQLEVICAQRQLEPIVLKTSHLPPFVKKRAGSSGIILGNDFSGINIEMFGRENTIYTETGAIRAGGDSKRVTTGTGPIAMCTGYGLTCCQLDSEIGMGEQVSVAQDCPLSCYTSCRRRPVLLALITEPFINPQSRQVSIANQEVLTVNYNIQPGAASAVTITLDFGDGVVEQATDTTGTFTHTYDCLSTTCTYTARATVVDSDGVTAADAAHSAFTVLVTQ